MTNHQEQMKNIKLKNYINIKFEKIKICILEIIIDDDSDTIQQITIDNKTFLVI